MTWPQLLFDETIWIPHCSFWHIFDWNQWPMHLCRCPNCVVVFPPLSFFWYTKSIWEIFGGDFVVLSLERPHVERPFMAPPPAVCISLRGCSLLLKIMKPQVREMIETYPKLWKTTLQEGVSLIIDKTK